MTDGWVYFVRFGPFVKIGITTNIAKRFQALSTSSPVPLEVAAASPGYRDEEATLHAHFSPIRHHGEWFLANTELDNLITEARTTYGIPEPPSYVPQFCERILRADDDERLEEERVAAARRTEINRLWCQIARLQTASQPVPDSLYIRLWRTQSLVSTGVSISESLVEQAKYRTAA